MFPILQIVSKVMIIKINRNKKSVKSFASLSDLPNKKLYIKQYALNRKGVCIWDTLSKCTSNRLQKRQITAAKLIFTVVGFTPDRTRFDIVCCVGNSFRHR